MKIFLSLLSVFALVMIFGKINFNNQFSNSISILFSEVNDSDKTFTYQKLEGLPDPVQRYFKNVLKDEQPYINSARLRHDGFFKMGIGKDWTKIRGEQYFTSNPPGFIWLGKTTGVAATDSYVNGEGSLVVTLVNMMKVVNGKGETFNQGELLRWLGESVWFPTNLLPSEKLSWFPIDEMTAKLTFKHQGISLYYIIHFNDNNEITKMETERFYEGEVMKPWVGECFDYIEVDGVKVPSRIKASWILGKEKFTYVDFRIQEIEYEVPSKF